MPSTSKTVLQTVVVTLFSALILVQPLAAADSQHSSVVHCKTGTSDCLPTVGGVDHNAARRDRHGDCPRDSQDCDPRSKANRIRADRESRDRHACRD